MAHGVFDIDSFVTYFFDDDSSEMNQKDISLMEIVSMMQEALYARNYKQSYNGKHILILENILGKELFHEKVHIWQAMSSPLIILNFLNVTKLSRYNAIKLGLNRQRLSDTYPFLSDDSSDIDVLYQSHRMNFYNGTNDSGLNKIAKKNYEKVCELYNNVTWDIFIEKWKNSIESKFNLTIYEFLSPMLHIPYHYFNIIHTASRPCAMPLRIINHSLEGKEFKCFSGQLDYFNLINFTGDNLMEAFAYVNECLKFDMKIPSYNPLDSTSESYIGVYEVYRRMHQSRYSSERDLAISFLVSVDLAFMTDPMGDHTEEYECYESFHQLNVSLPYRFGYLIYSLLGFRILKISEDPVQSVEEWQNGICEYMGWYKPVAGLKNMLSYLMSIIYHDINLAVGDYELFKILYELNDSDKNWNNKINYGIEAINHYHSTIKGKITAQHGILIQLANVLYYRISNHGKFIIPFMYEQEIRQNIASTIFIYNGDYYYDFTERDMGPLHYNVNGKYEYLDQITMRSISRYGKKICGFLDAFVECRFQKNGLGCPINGLSDKECELRNKIGIKGNWCHWGCLLYELDLANNPLE